MGARLYAAAEWQSKALRFRRGPAKAQGRFSFLQSGAGLAPHDALQARP